MSHIFKPVAVSPHNHSDKSLDGGSTPEQMLRRAAELGRKAHCVTEHGNMHSAMEFWSASEKLYKDKKTPTKIQVIHGIEAYLQDPVTPFKTLKEGKQVSNYVHLTIHFKNEKAYKHMCSLSPKMDERKVIKVGEPKPILLLEELEPIAQDICICSSCLMGVVQRYVLTNDLDSAKLMYERIRSFVGPENWAVEVFPHEVTKDWVRPVFAKDGNMTTPGYFKHNECDPLTGLPFDKQRAPNQFVVEMAKKYGDKVLISQDSHFAYEKDKLIQDMKLGNGADRFRFTNSYHMMDEQECFQAMKNSMDISAKDFEEWTDNATWYLEKFQNYTFSDSKTKNLLPKMEMIYEVQPGTTTRQKLKELIDKHGKMPSEGTELHKIYQDRIDYELATLCPPGGKDWLPYFFLLEDIFSWARENSYACTVRGSAAGSQILYLLRVSITDAIKYGLSFDRFGTLERFLVSTPDIDSDVYDREVFLNRLLEKYGDKFALISTDGTLRLKSTIKDMERAEHGKVPKYVENMCVQIPGVPQGISDYQWLFGYTDRDSGAHVEGFIEKKNNPGAEALRDYRDADKARWDKVMNAIGIAKSKGVHAGGVVISSEPITDNFPVYDNNGYPVIGWTMKGVEAKGAIKYDFLGLKTLKSLGLTMQSINSRGVGKVTWEEQPHDPDVYRSIINGGKLAGIFQISTYTMRPFVERLKPKSIIEGANLIALVRPGALDAASPVPGDITYKSAAEYYVACVNNKAKPYYIHPSLEEFLAETQGIVLFQEQQTKIAQYILGLNGSEADAFRRATGKKDKELSEINANRIQAGCVAKGWTLAQGKQLADVFMAASRYSFNKSHGLAYFQVAYNGAYFKHHFPLDFWLGELTVHAGEQGKIREHLKECRHLILPIDIAKSHPTDWTIEKVGDKEMLRPPLKTVKGCGDITVSHLKSFLDTSLDEYDNKPVKEKKERKPREPKAKKVKLEDVQVVQAPIKRDWLL